MQTHCPLEVEVWYGGIFELEFCGHVDDDLFTRHSVIDDVSVVTITAQDTVEWLQKDIAKIGYSYENYSLSKPADYSTSLLHTITRLNTYKGWYNYLGNSSFENATISNSWLVAGAGATFLPVAGGLIGTNKGDLVYGSAAASVYQIVSFAGTKKLDTQQNWNFSIYLKSAGASSGTLRISGYTDAVETESANTPWSLTGGEGWRKFEIGYTIATATINKIRCTVTLASNVTLSMDCAMLIQAKLAQNWFTLNSNDGTGGTIGADYSMIAKYDTLGFDTDDVNIVHPWAIIKQNDVFWDHIIDIRDATAAYYLGMDSCGTLKYRSPFKTGYSDPSSILTVTGVQSVDTVIDVNQANHIIIHGIQIIKESDAGGASKVLWNAKNANSFGTLNGADIFETVAAGAYWPYPATYPEYWAKYSETN
jgi:hypothetical protein